MARTTKTEFFSLDTRTQLSLGDSEIKKENIKQENSLLDEAILVLSETELIKTKDELSKLFLIETEAFTTKYGLDEFKKRIKHIALYKDKIKNKQGYILTSLQSYSSVLDKRGKDNEN